MNVHYPATPYLRRLTPAYGWRGQLIRDRHGQPVAIVAVRIGPQWTDTVAIESEDRCIALRHRTDSDRLVVPSGPPGSSGAVWLRDGRCAEVLAELHSDSIGSTNSPLAAMPRMVRQKRRM